MGKAKHVLITTLEICIIQRKYDLITQN
uniref:Uncharacterized protein n=1 Tax=Ciona intestinalis TaxID=7719 RepID=H2XJK9_CIOIN